MSSGTYNLGTGKARIYNDLAQAIFKSLDKPVDIRYIDTPEEIRDSYQYFTEADMNKLMEAIGGYEFLSLEKGIEIYIKQLQNENR
jgi:ADP-L-glycero-D-manno-heptose 6-epimerase